jgi:HD-like signal output (HDOD) protein
VIIFFAAVAAGGGLTYLHRHAPPGCAAEVTLDRVSAALRTQWQLPSVIVENVRTVSSGFFGNRYECSADVARLLSGVAASDMEWHQVRYSSERPGSSPLTVVSVTVGPAIPLPPSRSFLDRIRAWF